MHSNGLKTNMLKVSLKYPLKLMEYIQRREKIREVLMNSSLQRLQECGC